MPQEFRHATIVNIFKNKGSASVRGNYRGISLLNIGGKILTKVMANRRLPVTELILPKSQSGFRWNRRTTDLIFFLLQLQEKAREHQSKLYVAFIDLTKAFDFVNRGLLWNIMERLGIPKKIIQICVSLYTNNRARVLHT